MFQSKWKAYNPGCDKTRDEQKIMEWMSEEIKILKERQFTSTSIQKEAVCFSRALLLKQLPDWRELQTKIGATEKKNCNTNLNGRCIYGVKHCLISYKTILKMLNKPHGKERRVNEFIRVPNRKGWKDYFQTKYCDYENHQM